MKRTLIALALATLLPLSAQAGEMSNTYVQAEYVNLDGNTDGFGVRGAYEFGGSGFYVHGSYNRLEIGSNNLDVDTYALGLGYAHGLSDTADLVAEVAYLRADLDGGAEGDGYRASIGVRGELTGRVEALVKANLFDSDDFGRNLSFTVGTQYKFNPNWGLVGEIEFDDESETYLVGVRASF